MGTTAEKLQAIVNSKAAIKTAINAKGGSLTDSTPLDEYATAISNLPEDKLNDFLGNLLTEVNSNTLTLTDYAFYGKYNIEDITLPSITTIPNECFTGCSGLENVSMANITSIPANCFLNLSNLETCSIPNATSVGASSFEGTSLTGELLTNLGTELVGVGASAFKGTDLTSITYSTNRPITGYQDDTYAFGESAFENCTSLTSVIYGFEGNFNSTSNNTVLFKQKTFKGCTALTTVTLRCINNATGFSLTVPQLQAEFFSGCTSLTSLTLITKDSGNHYARFGLANVNVFDNIIGPITIYVPSSRVSSYQTMTNWSQLYNDGIVTFVAIPEE